MKKTNLYVVTGGIGKEILFTNFIEELSQRDNNLISVASPYASLFSLHPQVYSVVDLGRIDPLVPHIPTIDSQIINKYIDEIIYFEPYFSNYLKLNHHIIDIWRKGLSLPPIQNTYTDVKCGGKNSIAYQKVMEHIKPHSQYIVVQLKGGILDNTSINQRDYHDEYQLLDGLSKYFTDYHFVVVRTQHNIYDERLLNVPNISFLEDIPLLDLQFVINNCLTFISTDSCIQHFAANKYHLKRGIVMWSNMVGPQPDTIGHQHNINLISEKIDTVYISDKNIINQLEKLLKMIITE